MEKHTEGAKNGASTVAPDLDAGLNSHSPIHRNKALFVGIIDCSVVISYLLGITPELWHTASLVIKLAIYTITFRSATDTLIRPALPLILVMTGLVGLSFVSGDYNFTQLSKHLGFLGHIVLTTALVKRSEAITYLRSAAFTIAAAALIHIITCFSGIVRNHYGRFYYLGDGHPNLGGEINAMGALAAALALRRHWLIGCLVVALISDLLMQSRASLIVVFCICLCSIILYDRPARAPLQRIGLLLVTLLCILAFLLAFGVLNGLGNALSDVLFLNDRDRGLGSGFVGRDTRWAFSTQLIEQNPLLGVGAGYFDINGYPTPHNFFLFALAENGIIGGFTIIATLAVYFARALIRNFYQGILVITTLPLLVFNDRFMNLNPYPFLLFIVLAIIGASARFKTNTIKDSGEPAARFEGSHSYDKIK